MVVNKKVKKLKRQIFLQIFNWPNPNFSSDKMSEKKTKKMESDSKFNEIIVEGSGQIVKMEVDCSAVVDEKIPLAQKFAKENKLEEALELLLGLEKQTRNGSDMHSSCKILVTVVQICYEVKQRSKAVFNWHFFTILF